MRDMANAKLRRSNSPASMLHANKDDHGSYVAPKKVGRNDPCWCGSSKKLKKCHMASTRTVANALVARQRMAKLIEQNQDGPGDVNIPAEQVLEALDSEEE